MFILLLEENSFSWRVTSLKTAEKAVRHKRDTSVCEKVWAVSWKVLTGRPLLCACASDWPTDHHLHAAGPPSHGSLRCHWSRTWRGKVPRKVPLCQKNELAVAGAYSRCKIHIAGVFVLLVDVVLDWQQVVAHSLEGKLVQDRRHRVKCPVQDDQLWTSFVWTLGRGEMDRSENQHMG